jgi:hypothetical protein
MILPPDSGNRDRNPADCDLVLLMRNVEEHVSAAWEIDGTLHGLLKAARCTQVGEEGFQSYVLAV